MQVEQQNQESKQHEIDSTPNYQKRHSVLSLQPGFQALSLPIPSIAKGYFQGYLHCDQHTSQYLHIYEAISTISSQQDLNQGAWIKIACRLTFLQQKRINLHLRGLTHKKINIQFNFAYIMNQEENSMKNGLKIIFITQSKREIKLQFSSLYFQLLKRQMLANHCKYHAQSSSKVWLTEKLTSQMILQKNKHNSYHLLPVTSTVKFINNCTYNGLQNCYILGNQKETIVVGESWKIYKIYSRRQNFEDRNYWIEIDGDWISFSNQADKLVLIYHLFDLNPERIKLWMKQHTSKQIQNRQALETNGSNYDVKENQQKMHYQINTQISSTSIERELLKLASAKLNLTNEQSQRNIHSENIQRYQGSRMLDSGVCKRLQFQNTNSIRSQYDNSMINEEDRDSIRQNENYEMKIEQKEQQYKKAKQFSETQDKYLSTTTLSHNEMYYKTQQKKNNGFAYQLYSQVKKTSSLMDPTSNMISLQQDKKQSKSNVFQNQINQIVEESCIDAIESMLDKDNPTKNNSKIDDYNKFMKDTCQISNTKTILQWAPNNMEMIDQQRNCQSSHFLTKTGNQMMAEQQSSPQQIDFNNQEVDLYKNQLIREKQKQNIIDLSNNIVSEHCILKEQTIIDNNQRIIKQDELLGGETVNLLSNIDIIVAKQPKDTNYSQLNSLNVLQFQNQYHKEVKMIHFAGEYFTHSQKQHVQQKVEFKYQLSHEFTQNQRSKEQQLVYFTDVQQLLTNNITSIAAISNHHQLHYFYFSNNQYNTVIIPKINPTKLYSSYYPAKVLYSQTNSDLLSFNFDTMTTSAYIKNINTIGHIEDVKQNNNNIFILAQKSLKMMDKRDLVSSLKTVKNFKPYQSSYKKFDIFDNCAIVGRDDGIVKVFDLRFLGKESLNNFYLFKQLSNEDQLRKDGQLKFNELRILNNNNVFCNYGHSAFMINSQVQANCNLPKIYYKNVKQHERSFIQQFKIPMKIKEQIDQANSDQAAIQFDISPSTNKIFALYKDYHFSFNTDNEKLQNASSLKKSFEKCFYIKFCRFSKEDEMIYGYYSKYKPQFKLDALNK